MKTLKINVLYNEKAPQDADFAEGFSADLKKCLLRYLPDYSIESLVNQKGGVNNFIIVSNESVRLGFDNKDVNENATYIHISPLVGKVSAGSERQILFWDKQYETGEVREFRRSSAGTKTSYWEKITDIAIDIHNSILGQTIANKRSKVYLSIDDDNQSADRENIKRDLNDLGFEVLPDNRLSMDFKECTKQVNDSLEEAVLIIQIVPPIYNIHFAESHLSLTEHQCNLSAKMLLETKKDVKRLIWIPSAYEVSDEENQIFIEKIQRDQDQSKNTIVLKTSIEDLKKHYRKILLENISNPDQDSEVDVYVVADDVQVEKQVKQVLNGLKISAPSDFNGITFTKHLSELANARSVVICYTQNNKQWLAVKINDILKSKGIDLAKRFEKVVLLQKNVSIDKTGFENVFTDFVDDLSQLQEVINTSSNTKNT